MHLYAGTHYDRESDIRGNRAVTRGWKLIGYWNGVMSTLVALLSIDEHINTHIMAAFPRLPFLAYFHVCDQ